MSSLASPAVPLWYSWQLSFSIGNVIHDWYQLLHWIGSGSSATAWLVWDQECVVSFDYFFLVHIWSPKIWICHRQSHYLSLKMTPKGHRRIPPCRCPGEAVSLRLAWDGEMHPGSTILLWLFNDFTLEAADPLGIKHSYDCIVTNVLGNSVRMLCHNNQISLPWDVMKQVVFYILLGLDYLHNLKGVIHEGEATCVTPISILYQLCRSSNGQHSFGLAFKPWCDFRRISIISWPIARYIRASYNTCP